MRKILGILAIVALFASCTSPLMNRGAGPAADAGLNVVPVTTDGELQSNESVNYGVVIVKAVPGFDEATFKRLGATVDSQLTINGGNYYRLTKATGVTKLINSLRITKGVLYAEPELVSKRVMPITRVADATSRALTGGDMVLDPRNDSSGYSLDITKALDSYNTTTGNGYGANTVYVAVIDTGLNWTHDDFWINDTTSIIEYAKSAFNKAADGTMTWVGDKTPFVTIAVPATKSAAVNWDDEAHGTHVTGTIAALGDNNKGVAGVAWKNTKVISYKCFANAEAGSGADWSIYGALGDLAEWVKAKRTADATFQKTLPVNMSLGGDFAGSFEYEMINFALEQGVLPVVAMGNDGKRMGQFPASYQGVVAVGATNGKDEKVHFSNTGAWISVSAPGYDIISTGNGGSYWQDPESSASEYQWMSGTSMATPFVTGMVGYLLSFNKDLTPYQVKAVLEQTADDKGTVGFDEDYGYGRVNVLTAATMVKSGTGLPVAGVTYVEKKIIATVSNTSGNYDSGLGTVKTVDCSKRLIDQTVSLYDASGDFVSLGLTNGTNGEVEFRGLPPGDYTLKTNFFGDVQTQAITLDNTADKTASFSYNKNIVYICTVPAMAFNAGADKTDTVIDVYSDEALTTSVGSLDKYMLDTLSLELAPGTYYLKITAYGGAAGNGNYGLQVGFANVSEVAATVTDGARLATADDSHEDDDTGVLATAKGVLTLDTPYAFNLIDAADVFMFTIAP